MVDHHENFDSYLVLATDQSAKETQTRKNVTRMKGHMFENRLCPDWNNTRERAIPDYMRTSTPATQKDGVHEFCLNHTHAFKCGSTLDPSDQNIC